MPPLVGFWKRRSLKTKQLMFFAGIILAVLAITGYLSVSSARAGEVFRHNLDSYFRIYRVQRALNESRQAAESYFRDGDEEQLQRYYRLAARLWVLYDALAIEAETGLESYFEVNAIGAGLRAYAARASNAINQRQADEEGYYRTFEDALRPAYYVDRYLDNLLQIRLTQGDAEYSAQLARSQRMRATALGGVGLVALLLTAFAALFARTITQPILRLTRAAHRMADGELDPGPVPVASGDEIGVLGESFNRMRSNIAELVQDLREKRSLERRLHAEERKNLQMERALREAELIGLQSQINPHFFFNTLNTLARVSLLERAEHTTELIHSVSQVFRYMLQNPEALVSLEEELTIVRAYMRIQEVRFDERLRFELRCGVAPDAVMLPRLTLQPLVENAVKYGIEPCEAGGTVVVTVSPTGTGSIEITVRDDGAGMPPERLEEVLGDADLAPDSPDGNGIGLHNVAHRLRLIYRGRERFAIESSPGAGTTVHILLPEPATGRRHVSHSHSG